MPSPVKAHRIADNFDVFDFQLSADEVTATDSGVRGGPHVVGGSVS